VTLPDDTYLTIGEPAEGLFKDKGSRFLAYAHPFRAESELKGIIADLKARHPKARHHCWAYRLTPDRSVYRTNDDGEPSGTAGRPILNVLLSKDITDVLLVVVRYFGGTLLGVPGLINAYKTAAQEAIATATLVEKTVTETLRIAFDYPQMNTVMRLVKAENLSILGQQFDNRCFMDVEVRKTHAERIARKFGDVGILPYPPKGER